jgi:hypothetical protein
VRREKAGPLPLKELPVDQLFQLRQFIAQIDHVGQAGTQEIVLLFLAGMGLHRGSEISKVSKARRQNPAIPRQNFSTLNYTASTPKPESSRGL